MSYVFVFLFYCNAMAAEITIRASKLTLIWDGKSFRIAAAQNMQTQPFLSGTLPVDSNLVSASGINVRESLT